MPSDSNADIVNIGSSSSNPDGYVLFPLSFNLHLFSCHYFTYMGISLDIRTFEIMQLTNMIRTTACGTFTKMFCVVSHLYARHDHGIETHPFISN